MAPRYVKPKSNFNMEENLRIAVHLKIDAFIENSELLTFDFPSTLSNVERGYIHTYVAQKGLKSKSYGKGIERRLTIFKPKDNTRIGVATMNLSADVRKIVHSHLEQNPLTEIERKHILSSTAKSTTSSFHCTLSQSVLITVPPATNNLQAQAQRQSLPIFQYRQHIINTIDRNQVVVISGDTGSGKTTQVPQYLLEAHQQRAQPCRIICTQPRRIAAISIADRVAFERGERLGQTIGYQVRLESQLSSKSNLVFTTSGYLLRCLVSGTKRELFNTTTHIILDEVHERDKFTDFLLIAIKDALSSFPNLKIILMSATIDSDVFVNYFNGGCPFVNIPGRMFDVKIYHLEETLAMVGYTNHKIQVYRDRILNSAPSVGVPEILPAEPEQTSNVEPEMARYLDGVLQECEDDNTADEAFGQWFYLVTGESVPIDFKHTESNRSALMIAASTGNVAAVKTLLKMGANASVVDDQNRNAYAWAVHNQRDECAAILLASEQQQSVSQDDPNEALYKLLLQEYQSKTNEEEIDHYILFSLIRYIHITMAPGAILVFLPGYDAIVEQHETIGNYMNGNEMERNVRIFMLHGNMPASDQKLVFGAVERGVRKIILSTNIAETSLTIDDVVYVIDCGKVKQKSFDALSGATSLTSTYISQACAKQRMGRAGRVQAGVCFRLYSRLRHKNMDAFTLPELLRVPLAEISLNAKFLAGEASIADFLGKAVQPPSALSVSHSVQLLQRIGALDDAENITDLGAHLVDLPVDVQMGKTLLYAVLLKCLDPVLTIVSALSVKDPFVLPSLDTGDANTKNARKTLSQDTFSDHMVLLKVFQSWNEARASGTDRKFCHENFISNGSMEMICGVRSQLLSHLRSTGLIRHRAPGNIQDLNKNSESWAAVKAALAAGLYPNVCRIDRKQGQLKSCLVSKLIPHPTSVLRDKNPKRCMENLRALPSEWIVFGEKSRLGRFCMVRYNTVVSPLNIALFAGPIALSPDNLEPFREDTDSENDDDAGDNEAGHMIRYQVDDWIQFVADEQSAYYVYELRQKLSAIFLRLIQNPTKHLLPKDTQCVDLVVHLLKRDDLDCKLPQPKDVGRCPISVKGAFSRTDKTYGWSEGGAAGRKQSYEQKTDNRYNNAEQQRFQQQPGAYVVPQMRQNQQWQQQPQQQQQQSNWLSNQQNRPQSSRQFQARQQMQQHTHQKHTQSYRNDGSPQSATGRYFVLKASSTERIKQIFSTGNWTLSQSSLVHLMNIQRVHPSEQITMFFYVPFEREFFSVAKFLSRQNSYQVMPITLSKLSFTDVRSIKWYDNNNQQHTLDQCSDGEEITDEIANQLLFLFNSVH